MNKPIYLTGKVFQNLLLVFQHLKLLYPDLRRDFPTLVYLQIFAGDVFPEYERKDELIISALDLVTTLVQLKINMSKRSMISCSMMATAYDFGLRLSVRDLQTLCDFDVAHENWLKYMKIIAKVVSVANPNSALVRNLDISPVSCREE
ncbi:hypothetical protein Pmani_031491 [Petrolisthes manimaculis]|uniref:Uncharacterized protein n=1 Tax=Petrolisthes manimaculis TaxID=1843537 RepID=A0AAE1NVJ5_9EUCA|nr:hypothetical protein Pmani_031491 [Petrolisthes manimaculis]